MPISWNEIRQNAIRFSREWAEEQREDAEAKSFWDEFFSVFGMRRRLLATFGAPVRKINGQYGYIDLFWRDDALAQYFWRGDVDLDRRCAAFCRVCMVELADPHGEAGPVEGMVVPGRLCLDFDGLEAEAGRVLPRDEPLQGRFAFAFHEVMSLRFARVG